MPDTFALTIIAIVIVTIVAAFIKGRAKDKCLMDFSCYPVTIELSNGKAVWGTLRVETTGLELSYDDTHIDKDGHNETSYIIYKSEFPNVISIARYLDGLDDSLKNKRELQLKRAYHPSFFKRLGRRIRNFANTVKDSVMDVINLLIGQVKKTNIAGSVITSQDKYVNQLKQELVGTMETSYEPLLERHIGHTVILEFNKGGKRFEYSGILKDYSAMFIEMMDVKYKMFENDKQKRGDIIVPRSLAAVRHLGE